jgi:hypothetical protein
MTLIKKIEVLSADKINEVEDFVEFLGHEESNWQLTRVASKLSEKSFAWVWDNPEDAIYDKLRFWRCPPSPLFLLKPNRLESQVVEILGRNWIINELMKAGIEVASPIRDHGIDLIAYLDQEKQNPKYISRPIQLKASSQESFSMDQKYQKMNGLLLI